MSMPSSFRRTLLIGLIFMSCASLSRLPAQVTTATVSGTVTDTSGAVVPGAKVDLKNLGTDVAQSLVTDA